MAGKDQGNGKGKGKGKDQGRAGNAEKKRDKIEPNKPAPKKFTGPDPVPVWEGDSPSKIEGDAWREAVLAGAVNAMKSDHSIKKLQLKGTQPHQSSTHPDDLDPVVTAYCLDANGNVITTVHFKAGKNGAFSKRTGRGLYSKYED